jgi:hypothetical protein
MANASKFNLKNFWAFCASLRIDTKELGLTTLKESTLLGTQRYFIEEVSKGLDEGVHTFVVLKGRQLGITTICLALDLYWLFKHEGMSGSMVTHDEETRDMFRSTLAMYMDGLPVQFKIPMETHNRSQMVLKNRSRFSYQVAGTRKNTKLGKGKALTFLHATECSEYGDEEGLASLEASLAEQNPNRLFVWETTAQGYNAFFDMWEDARASRVKRAIFIGWWRNEFYRKKKGSIEHTVYWDGKLHPEEKKWVRQVKQLYDFDIDDEQIAWWRWAMAEKSRDETLHYQNYPPTEEYAFVLSGSQFFNSSRINDEYKRAASFDYHSYRFVLREAFEDTDITECGEKNANLKIWEFPKAGGHYVIGADPAYGSSEWADRFCVTVYRCYSDGVDQVAEFCTPDCSTYQFAWVMIYLAASYINGGGSVMVNLEINGPGQAVWQEIQNLKRTAVNQPGDAGGRLYAVIANIQNYLYKRLDSMGAPGAYHWKTTADTKERAFNLYKDCFERGMLLVRSRECIDEMKNVIRDDGQIGAPGRGKDDRVVAGALALVAWADFVRIRMVQMGITRAMAAQKDSATNADANNVSGFLKAIGLGS